MLQITPEILSKKKVRTEMLCIFHLFTKQSATEPYTSDSMYKLIMALP